MTYILILVRFLLLDKMISPFRQPEPLLQSNKYASITDTTLLKRFYHLPSGSKYDICILESDEMKNRAFALLHRKYIAESKTPWQFPAQNPSKIRTEQRTVDGIGGVSVLVDDFQHSALTLGIVSATGRVVGTGRILLRDRIPDGRLEVERYNSLPDSIQTALETKRCRIEVNRLAIDETLKGAGSAWLLFVAILLERIDWNQSETIVWTQPLSLFAKCTKAVPGYRLLAKLNQVQALGSFKYSEDDPEPAMVSVCSKFLWITVGTLRAFLSGTILLPKKRLVTGCNGNGNFIRTIA